MNVMVADTSVLIDLERGGFLEKCFRLPYKFTVPDLLYRNELARRGDVSDQGRLLLKRGLRVEELSENEVSKAVLYRRNRPSLSLQDSFALALAAGRRWTLITGDGVLREFAVMLPVVCYGVFWLLDQLFDAGVSTRGDLAEGLRSIRGHPRCRLPKAEVAARIALYSSTTRLS